MAEVTQEELRAFKELFNSNSRGFMEDEDFKHLLTDSVVKRANKKLNQAATKDI